MIRLEGVRKSYDGGRTWAVDGVDLEVAEGEMCVLLGESGCGKTTTLKTINRLVEPNEGRVEVEGLDARALDPVLLRRRIGYVFQEVGLFPHMSVAANVAVVPRLLGWKREEIGRRTDELLDLVGLPPAQFRERLPRELSGGQAQRVGLARALAARPRILLLDEPLGALDPLTRGALQGELAKLHRELGLTSVLVTHDMTEALLLGERIAVMDAGRIRRSGTPRELLAEREDEHVARLMAVPRRQFERLDALASEGGGASEAEPAEPPGGP